MVSRVPRVVVVLGLCGSGKSTLARRLEAEGFRKFDEGVVPRLPNWEPFLAAVRSGVDCVVVDIGYYFASNRAALARVLAELSEHIVLEYRCFESDLSTANENCRRDAAAGRRAQHACQQNLVQNAAMIEALERGELTVPDEAQRMKIATA